MQTFTGREYLKIDIANSFGHDKLTWQQRIGWFDANRSILDSLVPQAEEPALFYAGIKAYYDVEAGLPTGYMISLDATSSGLQLLACLTGDSFAAKLCNVVETGNREDAYTFIYQHMLRVIKDTSKISRDDTKQAIMTAFYNSKAVPKKIFGEGALLDVFYDTLKELAPGAWELNEAMLSFWDPNALEHSWVLPDNFHVHIKVMAQVRETVHFVNEPFDVFYNINAPIAEGRSLGANTIHSIDGMIVRELTRRCFYKPNRIQQIKSILNTPTHRYKSEDVSTADRMVQTLWAHYTDSGYLSARILDYLTIGNMGHVDPQAIDELVGSLPEKPFKIISIHDCFRCLPHYGNDMREQYTHQLRLIAQSNMLQSIISQLLGRQVQIGKFDPNLHLNVGQSNYALS
jgi:hypothetical protein